MRNLAQGNQFAGAAIPDYEYISSYSFQSKVIFHLETEDN